MRYISFYSILFLFFISEISFGQDISMMIHSNWQFRQVGNSEWLNAEVPGTVHTDLLKNGKINDPFYGMNEKDLQWIEKEDWEYQTTFNANGELITRDKIELDFQGLDTYADVYLNDSMILESNNMFRSWQVDITEIIRRGENELRIYFHSPINKTEPIYDHLGYTIPVSSNDQADKKLSVFTRKAPYHYGWDWGPRFVTSGIWRPIILRAWNSVLLKDVYIEQHAIAAESASIIAHFEYIVTKPFFGTLEIVVDDKTIKTSTVDLKIGTYKDNLTFSIDNPSLWWPNGMGDQKLYSIELNLKKEEQLIQSKKIRIGLRTIELIQEPDKKGSSFYFKVNGKSVFMKGANYIPQDNFLPRVSPEKYEHILQSATDANMNMIRVWGGGIYENDIFYDLCDEKGLLVWQDFMFSCAMYPGDEAFLENVTEEAEENVKRLRNHPSLALWCGNNEILMKWYGWRNNANEEGKQIPLWKNSQDSMKIVDAYTRIFENILPDVVKNHAMGVPYWESSPSAKGGTYEDWKTGDAHYWGVWWGQEPFEAYRDNIGRFMTEYGFQSFPEIKTVKTFTNENDWDIYSDVMQSHQRSSIGNRTIANYMSNHFRVPNNFPNYLYVSQLLQAEGVKVAMEAHRIKKTYNMGSLVWQLDDCWPVASWSSIDYFGRWKALHYYIKRAFQDVIVAFESSEEEIKIYTVSDLYSDQKITLITELLDFNGKILISDEKKIKLKANSSEEIWKSSKKELLKKLQGDAVYLRARLLNDKNLIAENTYFFVPFKNLKLETPDIKYDFIEKEGKLYVTLKSNKTALGVYFDAGDIDPVYSDNYFTLHAKEEKIVEVKGKFEPFEIKNKLTIKSLTDSY